MKRVHKVLWLIIIIIAIGVVAVATRTPHRKGAAARAADVSTPAAPADQAGPAADSGAAKP